MSSLETSAAITDILRQQYRATLLEIKRHLTNDQKEDLRFYCTDNIPEAETMEILEVFRSLENVQKISWEDVGFLKKGLYAVRRLDLVEILTGFENKRDLTKLIVEIVDDSLASKDGRHSLKPEDIERGWSAANELYCWMQRHQISWVSCQIYSSLKI